LGIGVRWASVILFSFLCYAGFAGTQAPTQNILPTFLWVGLWVGLAYFAALVANIWPAVNPYLAIYDGFVVLFRRNKAPAGTLRYPAGLGAWPAVAGLLAVAWLELVAAGGERPALLAAGMLAYAAFCLIGMALFGREWLARGDVFTVAFAVLGRFAPFGTRRPDDRDPPGRWVLRWPGAGLLLQRPLSFPMTVFVLVMLSNVTFDGFLETPLWNHILDTVATSQALRPWLLDIQSAGVNLLGLLKTAGLVAFPLLFLASYAGVCVLVSIAGGRAVDGWTLARWFVLTLVPIAIAYHLAHYASFFALAGQLMIPLASDPLGRGWDLFGTAHVHVDPSVISARFVWFTSVGTIVAGHVIAVLLAHLQTHRVIRDPRAATLSQLPMLALMIGYTMTSLWILSQPVVKA
ncbi:MAG: fenitrothion hydrolase, partial [Gammaproteobacteria bacterium]|nr:fenitrothion hydrolase [Gammaproteobacteria bacterium]